MAPIVKKGEVTVKYLDNVSKKAISAEDKHIDLSLKDYEFKAKPIDGYYVCGDDVKTVSLSEEKINVTINFYYEKNKEEVKEDIVEKDDEEITQDNNAIKSEKTKGIFSWSRDQIYAENREDVIEWSNKLQLNEFYQSGLFRVDEAERINFVKDMKNHGVDIYALTGEAAWWNDSSKLIKRIQQVKDHNDIVSDDAKIKGIVLDVEPWCLGDGNWTQEGFAATVKEAYEYASKVNVEMVMVIPFWLEEAILETIIKNSDKTIVMNYNIKNPVKFIQEEIALAKKYNKKITTAAETQKSASEFGVDSTTTYYYVGVDRLVEDWEAIDNEYNYEGLEFSLHDFKNIKEFIK